MDNINIRDLQHFLYCKHRWGLIKIDDVWAENIFVIKANLMHENVHNADKTIYKKGEKILNSVRIYNDELELFGVTDSLSAKNKQYTIIEHKPTQPKNSSYNVEDALQVFAQKVCVDYVFNTNCKAYLYYKNQKAKILLPFDGEYDFYYSLLVDTISEMKYYMVNNELPKIKKGQKCSGCSFKDICMPTKRHTYNVKNQIYKTLEAI